MLKVKKNNDNNITEEDALSFGLLELQIIRLSNCNIKNIDNLEIFPKLQVLYLGKIFIYIYHTKYII